MASGYLFSHLQLNRHTLDPILPGMPPSGVVARPCRSRGTTHAKWTNTSSNFFDLLSRDAISNVVRFVSLRPLHRNWMLYVTAEDALTLFMYPSPLSTVACATLTSFCSVPGSDSIGAEKQLVKMLSHEGHAFLEAHLDDMTGDSHVWLPVFEKEWVNIRTISPRGEKPLEKILRARGERLDNISIFEHRISSSEIRSLSVHCKALRKLSINVTRECYEQFSDIWAYAGKHVEELHLMELQIDV